MSNVQILMPENFKRGQLILEVVVAIGISAMVLVGLLSVVNRAVRNTDAAIQRSNASFFAKEGVEFVRKARDQLGWVVFRTSYEHGLSYGLSASDLFPSGTGCNPLTTAANVDIFTRCIRFVHDGSPVDKMTVTTTVSWDDGHCPASNKCKNIEAVTYFTKWGR